jgi:hypothetical protein
MAVSKGQSRSVLGDNPLNQSIFSKTVADEAEPQPTSEQKSIFLEDVDKEDKEALNLRLPIKLNDWLNERLKRGKRLHKHKIPKEIWVQTALEFLIAMPVNWDEIDSEESLREALFDIYSSQGKLKSL